MYVPPSSTISWSTSDGHSLRDVPPSLPSKPTAYGWLIGAIAASTILLALLLAWTGLRVELTAADTLPYYAAGATAITLRIGTRRTVRPLLSRLGRCAEYYALFTFMALLGAIASYPVAAASHGFVDAGLARIDTLLHFDWLRWYRAVRRPSLAAADGTYGL